MNKNMLALAGLFVAASSMAGEKTYLCSDELVGIKVEVTEADEMDKTTAQGVLGDIPFSASFVGETQSDGLTLRTYTDEKAVVTVKLRKESTGVALDCRFPDGTEWMVGCKKKR